MTEPSGPSRTAPAAGRNEREVLNQTLDVLARDGVAAVSPEVVARAAGVPLEEVTSRWSSTAELITAAVASLIPSGRASGSAAPFDELVSELLAFRRTMAHPAVAAVLGAVLDEAAHPELARLHREQISRPQRARVRRSLELAKRQGLLDADDGDLDAAVSACLGSWYALAVAGVRPARDWGPTAARLTWRSLGGAAPATAPGR